MTDKPKPYTPGMTLMPGESTAVEFSFPVPPEIARRLKPGEPIEMVEVPPPDEAPIDPEAEKLGLARGLRAEINTHSPFRCGSCHEMQPVGAHLVWVAEGLYPNASPDLVAEVCRRNAYNGHTSGWCLKCAKTLGGHSLLDKVEVALGQHMDEIAKQIEEADLIGDVSPMVKSPLVWWLTIAALVIVMLVVL